MDIKELNEKLEQYIEEDETKGKELFPTERQRRIASLIEDLFKGIIIENGLKNTVEVDERTIIDDQLGEDFPEVRICVGTEDDPNEPFFVSFVFPSGDEDTIKTDLENCPLTVSLYSDVFGLDELFPLDEEGTTEDEQISKLAETIKAELV